MLIRGDADKLAEPAGSHRLAAALGARREFPCSLRAVALDLRPVEHTPTHLVYTSPQGTNMPSSTLPLGSHQIMQEQPAAVNSLLDHFLERLKIERS